MPPSFTVHCGPAGWAYAQWSGTVYPAVKPRGFHPLEYLSGYFNAIEINASFQMALRPELARLWIAKVAGNPDFLFTAKLHRAFSHERKLERGAVSEFKEGLFPLLKAGRLGCVLMQFPWSFRFTEENRQYLIEVCRAFHEFPLAAELRHSSWMLDEALGTLVDRRVSFCNIDQPQSTRTTPPSAILTSSIGYVRLHGRSTKNWLDEFGEPEREAAESFLYGQEELREWKGRIDQIRKHADRTFVIANNDGPGTSAVNALQLQAMAGGRTKAPVALLNAYPEELREFTANQPVQRTLFAARGSGRRVA